MRIRLRISEHAEQDIERGFSFYEKQAPGIGAYFLNTVNAEIDSLLLYAGIHRKAHGMYRALVPRFPFVIYYEIEDETVCIWAILDCRSKPETMQRKINKRRPH